MVRLLKAVCAGSCAGLLVVILLSGLLPSLMIRPRTASSTTNQRESSLHPRHHHQLLPSELAKSNPQGKLGYFMSMKYYEQQTQATKNFLQMQCLASSYGMRVVEPFIVDSQIAIPFSSLAKGIELHKFGDIMDMNLWNRQTHDVYGYPPVASWDDFLSNAPRNLVIVCLQYRDPPYIKIPEPGYNFRNGCSKTCFEKFNGTLKYLSRYGFKMVRRACGNFVNFAGSVTDDAFIDTILGTNYDASNTTVVINQFRGFFGLYRLQVLSPCGLLGHRNINVTVTPSQRLVSEAETYARQNFNNRPYVSIMARIERMVLHSRLNMTYCAQSVMATLGQLREERGLEDYYTAMDVGKYGSNGASLKQLQPFGEKFLEHIYGNSWSFRKWEESFMRASSSQTPAYIANLQRTIAAKGECLLMVGAGGFQVQARNLYQRYHPNVNTQCIYKICTA